MNVRNVDRRIATALIGAATLWCLSGAGTAAAAIISYDLAWTGNGGYTMTGSFSFDSSSAADNRIDETELLSLSISGFLNGNPLGTWNLGDPYSGAQPFNFNFNPSSGLFLTGGQSLGPNGQNWNDDGFSGNSCGNPGFGFNSGSLGQDICVNGQFIAASVTTAFSTALVATRVPEPGTLALLGLGLAGLAASRRRKQ